MACTDEVLLEELGQGAVVVGAEPRRLRPVDREQVEPGQEVSVGAGLVVLEAMKMENELKAPAAATVGAVRAQPGEAVEKGQVLVEFQ